MAEMEAHVQTRASLEEDNLKWKTRVDNLLAKYEVTIAINDHKWLMYSVPLLAN